MEGSQGGNPPIASTAQDVAADAIPATLGQRGAVAFWIGALVIGLGTGASAVALTRLLYWVQELAWPSSGGHEALLDAASGATAARHLAILAAAGLLTGLGQLLLVRLSSGNGIDITEAIWFRAGRLPKLRTLGSAVLSVILVGMGTSLGREGAPKQAGAVIADAFSDRARLPDEQRRLLVACGAGAGMAAAYGVPLGGALFALEVMRGALAVRMVLPALFVSLVATAVSWLGLPDAVTYSIPSFQSSASIACWSLIAGPIAGLASVLYVRLIALADRSKPKGWQRFVAPLIALGALGAISIPFPQLLGNGKDVAELAFTGQVAPGLMLALVLLKPAATAMCLGSGAPGGLFTPSLSFGALLGGLLGQAWSWWWPGVPPGLFALVGATAVLAATTQGPISAVVLMMELTGRDRSFIVPVLLAVSTATLVSRTVEMRSIYDARLTDEQVDARRRPPPPSHASSDGVAAEARSSRVAT
jgi:H+/Cl- antiporter ClcA